MQSETTLTLTAKVSDELTVLVAIALAGVTTDLGVYGPCDNREEADQVARETVAYATRQIIRHKYDLLCFDYRDLLRANAGGNADG